MIYHYQISMAGAYHKRINMPCQDYVYFKKMNENVVIGAVADGFEYEKYSDVAAKIASIEAVNYCFKNYSNKKNDKEILSLIKNSFIYALNKIELFVKRKNKYISDFNTTLVVAIYNNGKLYFGSVGDSGIIVLRKNGLYEIVTNERRDKYGFVYSLCERIKWSFKKEENIANFMLATDGMLDLFAPIYLKFNDVKVYVFLLETFMNPNKLEFELKGEQTVQKIKHKFIASIPENLVDDDKTILIVSDSKANLKRQKESYYEKPDWKKLIKDYEKRDNNKLNNI